MSTVPVAASSAEAAAALRVFNAQRALLKALVLMTRNNMGKHCLSAAAVAAAILDSFQVHYEVVAGFTHVEGTEFSVPHVYLMSPGGIITDLSFDPAHPSRVVRALGRRVTIDEAASVDPTYTRLPRWPILDGTLPIQLLREKSRDLKSYITCSPPWMIDCFNEIMVAALDGRDSVEIEMPVEDAMLAGAGGGGAEESKAGG